MAAAGSSRTASSRCAPTTCTTRRSPAPAAQGAHEKGGVEGEVGRYRRAHLVPVPKVDDAARAQRPARGRLLRRLRAADRAAAPRRSREAFRARCGRCGPLPVEEFDTAEPPRRASTRRRWSRSGKTATRSRSRWSGLRVAARIGAREIVLSHQGREVACHPRLHGRYQTAARLDHYLELLAAQAGRAQGLACRCARSASVAAGRAASTSSGSSSRIATAPPRPPRRWSTCSCSCREHGGARVELAVRGALAAGAHDGRAVALLARKSERPAQPPLFELPAAAAATTRPEPTLADYDALLSRGGRS